ncbi:MAG: hypothetical protein ACM3SQ_08170 [Betaproteobacteria bacterium]
MPTIASSPSSPPTGAVRADMKRGDRLDPDNADALALSLFDALRRLAEPSHVAEGAAT